MNMNNSNVTSIPLVSENDFGQRTNQSPYNAFVAMSEQNTTIDRALLAPSLRFARVNDVVRLKNGLRGALKYMGTIKTSNKNNNNNTNTNSNNNNNNNKSSGRFFIGLDCIEKPDPKHYELSDYFVTDGRLGSTRYFHTNDNIESAVFARLDQFDTVVSPSVLFHEYLGIQKCNTVKFSFFCIFKIPMNMVIACLCLYVVLACDTMACQTKFDQRC